MLTTVDADTTTFSRQRPVALVVTTHAERELPVSAPNSRHEWQRVIDEKLIEWAAHPEQFDEEGIESPGREVVSLAIQLAVQLRDAGELPPHRVVMDANGGLVFERRTGTRSFKLHIWDDRSVELIVMDGTRVTERQRLK